MPVPICKPGFFRLLIVFELGFLGACTSLTPQGAEQEVRVTAQKLSEQAQPTDHSPTDVQLYLSTSSVEERLQQPLSVDDAVQLALVNNPELQRLFADLRFTETEIVAATRLPNPGISVASLSRQSEHETERAVSFDLLGLLTLPVRGQLAKAHWEAAKLQATQALLTIAQATRQNYFAALAASVRAEYAADVLAAAEAAQELAADLAKAGNIPRLDAAREQVFYHQAQAEFLQRQAQARAMRERLIVGLGLENGALLKLPAQLPDLPGQPRELPQVEQTALDQRIDVQLAVRHSQQTAKALKLTKVTRLVNVLDLGYQSNTSNQQATQQGFEVRLELPLFDFGTTRIAQAEAIYQRSLAEVAVTALRARSEARQAYADYQSAYTLAQQYRDQILPLQKQISHDMLLRYNGMLVSPFELLIQTREQIHASEQAVSALENFWQAETGLGVALQGSSARIADSAQRFVTN